jgi:ribosomal protein S18 acetylase RimI-like enzyme
MKNRAPDRYASFPGSQLDDPDVVLFVAESDAGVIGHAYAAIEGYDWMGLRGPAAVLHDLVVDPGYRGRGVGRLLLDAALSHLRSRGAPRVVLSTAERAVDAKLSDVDSRSIGPARRSELPSTSSPVAVDPDCAA